MARLVIIDEDDGEIMYQVDNMEFIYAEGNPTVMEFCGHITINGKEYQADFSFYLNKVEKDKDGRITSVTADEIEQKTDGSTFIEGLGDQIEEMAEEVRPILEEATKRSIN